jgi:(2Fe-2S) ferredoxin
MDADMAHRVAAVLVAKSAIAAGPFADMRRLAERVAAMPGIAVAAYGFTEHGTPSLRDAIRQLRDEGCSELVLLPMLVPMEPSFLSWLGRVLARWQAADPDGWPIVRVAPPPVTEAAFSELLADMVESARAAAPFAVSAPNLAEGVIVPAQKRRVLICMGGACNNAGAATLWGHLRTEQARRQLRTAGDGTMTAKSSCLGPCNLAPVVQVWPEGTYYGGVDETGIDRIIDCHLLRGEIVDDLAYAPLRTKQTLRNGGECRPATAGTPQAAS